MRFLLLFFLAITILSSCTTTYFIVRHAEKATATGTIASNDPPLTEAGQARALALEERLKKEKIGYIFSTNTIRTRTTAEPTRAYFNLVTETYAPRGDSAFFARLRSLKKNVLIVGHSNTVDDLVNQLCGTQKIPGDLPETAYDNLFVVKKKGKKMSFENLKYGAPTP